MIYLIGKRPVTREYMLSFLRIQGWRSKGARNYLASMEKDGAEREIAGDVLVVKHDQTKG